MDVTNLRKNIDKRLANGAMKRQISKTIKDYRDGREERRFELKELYEPITATQKEVKKTIDKKQDELIEKLQENQQDLINSIEVLSDIMSKQGSTSGIGKWISDLPSKIDPLESIFEEDDGQEDGGQNYDIFSNVEREVLKKI